MVCISIFELLNINFFCHTEGFSNGGFSKKIDPIDEEIATKMSIRKEIADTHKYGLKKLQIEKEKEEQANSFYGQKFVTLEDFMAYEEFECGFGWSKRENNTQLLNNMKLTRNHQSLKNSAELVE